MSDENEEHNHPHIAAFQIGPTPEQLEQQRLAGINHGHETREFFDSLTIEQLKKLANLFAHCHSSEGDAALYYYGLCSSFLDLKYNLCMSCGEDHDKALDQMAGQAAPVPPKDTPSEVERPTADDPLYLQPVKGTDLYNRLMDEYNMEPDEGGSDHVMCKGCKTWYKDLADRMLRPPGIEGCSTCIQKQKWG